MNAKKTFTLNITYWCNRKTCYVNGKKVQTSLSSYYGNVRYRFNKEDMGKKVLIKYDNNRTLEDRLTDKYKSIDSKYWIVDDMF